MSEVKRVSPCELKKKKAQSEEGMGKPVKVDWSFQYGIYMKNDGDVEKTIGALLGQIWDNKIIKGNQDSSGL